MSNKRKKARFTKLKATEKKIKLLEINNSVTPSTLAVNQTEPLKGKVRIEINSFVTGESLIIKVISIGNTESVISKKVDRKQSPYIRGLASILDLRGTRYIGLRKHHLPDRVLLARDLQSVGSDMRQAITKLGDFRRKIKCPKNTSDIERV